MGLTSRLAMESRLLLLAIKSAVPLRCRISMRFGKADIRYSTNSLDLKKERAWHMGLVCRHSSAWWWGYAAKPSPSLASICAAVDRDLTHCATSRTRSQ